MNRKLKVNPPKFIFMLFGIAFAAFSCEHENTVDANKGEEITWQQTALDSLDITALAANSSGSVFAGTCGNGIFRSTDRGNTWTYVNKYCTISLAINAKGDIFAGIGATLIRSTDNGNSWILLNFPFGVNHVGAIAFGKSGGIFVSSGTSDESRGGIYRSVDNGNTWMHTGLTSPTIGSLVINTKGYIFAGSSSYSVEPEGVFYSTDNGRSWSQINKGLTNRNVTLTIDSSGYVYAGTGGEGVFRTAKSTSH